MDHDGRFEVRIVLSAMAVERGGDRQFVLLVEDEKSKVLTMPNVLLEPGDIAVTLTKMAKKYITAPPEWYGLALSTFIKRGEGVYLIYSTRMTSNIRTLNNSGWFALESIQSYKGRISANHLPLLTVGINNSEFTR
jgi:hypothetical protein